MRCLAARKRTIGEGPPRGKERRVANPSFGFFIQLAGSSVKFRNGNGLPFISDGANAS
jgi:hypothetical protein